MVDRVTYNAAPQGKDGLEINYAAEREAAEWVLSIGGSVTVLARDGREIPFEAGRLPEQDFSVRDILVDGSPELSTTGFEKLCRCRALERIGVCFPILNRSLCSRALTQTSW